MTRFWNYDAEYLAKPSRDIEQGSDPGNAVLAALLKQDRERLQAIFTPLTPGQVLLRVGVEIEHVYFLEGGFAGLLASSLVSAKPVQLAMVGREGGIGLLEVVTGSQRALATALVQVGGASWRVPAEQLRAAMLSVPALGNRVREAVQGLVMQTMQVSSDNATSLLLNRCARWLAMAYARLDGEAVRVTHDALAELFAVRRAGVTVALKVLQSEGVIEAGRGWVRVVDAARLSAVADGRLPKPH